MYYVGFSFVEAWNLPISWRRWFIQRLNTELEKNNGGGETNSNQNNQYIQRPDIQRVLEQANVPSRRKNFNR